MLLETETSHRKGRVSLVPVPLFLSRIPDPGEMMFESRFRMKKYLDLYVSLASTVSEQCDSGDGTIYRYITYE
jgi:hypothetical protein